MGERAEMETNYIPAQQQNIFNCNIDMLISYYETIYKWLRHHISHCLFHNQFDLRSG